MDNSRVGKEDNTMTNHISAPVDQTAPTSPRLIRHLRRHALKHHARPVSWLTAQRIASSQGAAVAREATKLGVTVDALIAGLPQIRVETDETLPVSGLTVWDRVQHAWIIRLRTADTPARRHFTLLHEFKHILDHHASAHLYDPRYLSGHAQSEMAADAFASAALMPARLMRRLVLNEKCDEEELANRLQISPDRIALRLSDLNLQTEGSPSTKGEDAS